MSDLNAVVLDLETTGLNPRLDKIIEIGMGRIRDGKLTETFSSLVKPGRKLEEKTTEITGITNEMLSEGKEFKQIYQSVLDFIGDDVLLGHSITFDYSFLKKALLNEMPKKSAFEKKGLDTLKIARRCINDTQSKALPCICHNLGIEFVPHRALNDAVATYNLYERLFDLYYEKDSEAFKPFTLNYQVKKESPVMKKQIEQIERILAYYQLESDYDINKMTKSEASRYIDRLLNTYGHINSMR